MARILREAYWTELILQRVLNKAATALLSFSATTYSMNARGIVIAVAVTSQEPRAGFPLTLEITTAKLPKRSWARIGQIRTLPSTGWANDDAHCG